MGTRKMNFGLGIVRIMTPDPSRKAVLHNSILFSKCQQFYYVLGAM